MERPLWVGRAEHTRQALIVQTEGRNTIIKRLSIRSGSKPEILSAGKCCPLDPESGQNPRGSRKAASTASL